jgi:DNA-binding transcriptional LysR family regulator
MLDPQRLAVFAAVVQAGSISRAATKLNVDKSVVSRQLARLEADLGSKLIQRSTRRMALTEIGALLFDEARRIDQALANIEHLADQYRGEVRGKLTVSCSFASRRLMVPVVIAFSSRFPEVDVSLQMDDRMVDLIAEQIDVAIRASQLPDSTLIARKLADSPRVLVASPAYLERHGAPQDPAELKKHACLVYAVGRRARDEWRFVGPDGEQTVRVRGRIQVNDGGSLVDAACAGVGIMLIDRLLVEQDLADGRLVALLPQFKPPHGPPVYAVYPARDGLAPKTAAFVSFLQEQRWARIE